MSKNIITIKNLSKKFKSNTILENINLDIKKGNIYGIIGRNGSGKSILLKTIVGLIKYDDGVITVLDKTIINGEIPNNIGVLINSPGLLLEYSGFFNLKLLASINNKISEDDIYKTLSLVGLDPNDKRKVKNYSLGMKQKLGIAQALMENPDIVILDEPMNGLDDSSVAKIRELILDLKVQEKTIILTSHNKDDIDLLCDYVYKIENCNLEQIKNSNNSL